MSTSDQTYKAYSFADHSEVYSILEVVFKEFRIAYYLIGANARDVALYKAGQKPNRGTADIDFAVMVPDFESYSQLKERIKEKGFEDTNGNAPYRLFYPQSNTVIDLLPYGKIAQDHTVNFADRAIELSIVGMQEVGEAVEIFEHPDGLSIPVAPAHGIVILKLISWSEKPDRIKDLKDIKSLLEAAWQLYEAELYVEDSNYADLFDEDDFHMHLIAARVMGRKMQAILNQSTSLKQLIITEIEKELKETAGPKSIQIVSGTNQAVKEVKSIFNALAKGIRDEIQL